jgi:hypothetical protein
MIDKEKICNKCGLIKKISDFYLHKSSKKPYGNCIECLKIRHKEWAKNNKEKRAEYSRKSYKKDIQNLEKVSLRKISFDKWKISRDARFKEYKRGAKKRNIVFDLSYDDFINFWNKMSDIKQLFNTMK